MRIVYRIHSQEASVPQALLERKRDVGLIIYYQDSAIIFHPLTFLRFSACAAIQILCS